jgi:hypothetical protein
MRELAVTTLVILGILPVRADEKKAEPVVYQVPYRLTSTNHILIRAKINGKGPYNFILDTGAPALFVSTAVCRKLNVSANKYGWGTFERFEIEGGIVLDKCRGRIEDPFQLEGMNNLGLAGVPLHGVLGYTVIARFRLGFDFTKHKMTWQPLNFNPPAPEGLDGRSIASGMETVGSVMKLMSAFLGKRHVPEFSLRGFWGVLLDESGGGVTIKAVLPDGPAGVAGVKPGDQIVRCQGKVVHSIADVREQAAKIGASEELELHIMRGGSPLSIHLKTGYGI